MRSPEAFKLLSSYSPIPLAQAWLQVWTQACFKSGASARLQDCQSSIDSCMSQTSNQGYDAQQPDFDANAVCNVALKRALAAAWAPCGLPA